MSNLVFHIRGQALTVEPIEDVLVENSVNFLTATFILDKTEKNREWLGLSIIRAEFLHNNKPYREEISFTELGGESKKVIIPWEAIRCPGFSVSISGLLYRNNTSEVTKRITTGVVPIPLKQSGALGGLVSSEFGTETDFVLALQKLEEKVSHNDKEMDELQEDFDELEALVKGSEKINIGVNLLKNSQLIHHYSNMPELPLKETQLFDEEEEFYFYRYTFDYSKKPQADAEKNLLSLYNTIPLSNLTTPFKASADTRPDTDNEKNIYTLSFWARAKKAGESILFAWIKDKDIDKDPLEGINGTPSHNSRIILKDKWTRYHITIKLDRDYDTDTGILFFCPSDVWEYVEQGETRDPNYYIDLCNWKIEKGDKPTNWSSSLEKYEKQMVEIQTAFVQTGEKILAEVEGKVEDVNGKVNEVENKLTVDIEGVKTTSEEKIDGLTKSYSELKVATDKISSIVADGDYGINLLKGSGLKNQEDYSEWWDDLSGECFVAPYDENGKEIEWSHSIIKSGVSVNTGQFLPKNVIKPDTYYVLSFNIKIETPGNSNNKGNPRITMMERGQKVINSTPSWEKVGEGTDRVIYLNEKRDWTRYSMIVRYPKDKLEEYQNNEDYNLAAILEFTNLSDAVVYIKEAKFEEGVTPTDWAPGDDKKYESMIEQKSNEIKLSVEEQLNGLPDKVAQLEITAGNIATDVINVEKSLSSEILQTAEKISSIVVGTNLLSNSSFYRETFFDENGDRLHIPKEWSSNSNINIDDNVAAFTGNEIIWRKINTIIKKNKTYTFSIKILIPEELPDSEDIKLSLQAGTAQDYEEYTENLSLLGSRLGWSTLQVTFTTPDRDLNENEDFNLSIIANNIPTGKKVYFKEAQLEYGFEATKWEEKEGFLLEQSIKGLEGRLFNVEEGKTDYISFTEEGLLVGDLKQQRLAGNVRIFTENGQPGIQLRDGISVFASFFPEKIQLGLLTDKGKFILGEDEESGVVFSREKVTILPEYTLGDFHFPGLSLPFNFLSAPQLAIKSSYWSVYSNFSLEDIEIEDNLILQRNSIVLDPGLYPGENLSITGETKIAKGELKLFQFLPYNKENIDDYLKNMLGSLSVSSGRDFIKDKEYSTSYINQAGEEVKKELFYKENDSRIHLFPQSLEILNFNSHKDSGLAPVLNGLRIDDAGVSIVQGAGGEKEDIVKSNTALHYKDGDEITLFWYGTGFITNSATEVRFSIPLSKIIPKDLEVEAYVCYDDDDNSNIYIRQDGRYLWKIDQEGKNYVDRSYIVYQIGEVTLDTMFTTSVNNTDGNYINCKLTLMQENIEVNNKVCGVQLNKILLRFKKKNS